MLSPDPAQFLGFCEVIDHREVEITRAAGSLATNHQIETARNCFEFVRDEIRHSCDYQLNPVTCRASDVLRHRTGYCYAKSHLLAALLRSNGIPAGLCYQRLSVDGEGAPFCLHGLNAVYLPVDDPMRGGWYRLDARGNRDGVDARFSPPVEHLAFPVSQTGEVDFPEIHPTPLTSVVDCLSKHQTWDAVAMSLPDCELH